MSFGSVTSRWAIRACGLSAVAFGGMMSAVPALSQDFYAGKTINLYVGSGSGGGFDLYGRALARHMPKHIPGRPNIVVNNMPGAGSMKAAEFIYTHAPKDGTAFAIVFPGAIVEPLISSKEKFRFEPPKFEFLGSANSGARLCITFHTSKVKTFQDAQRIEATMGGSAAGDSTSDYALLFNALAGTKFKVVLGYKSTSETLLAVERGEVDGLCGFDAASFAAQRPAWYGTNLANIIVQASLEPREDLTKLGAPSILNFVSGDNRKALELVLAQQEFHRPFIAPPGTAPAQLAILRKAFAATMEDAEFLADAKKQNLDIAPKSGEVVTKLVKEMYATPAHLVALVTKALRP
jgi:tripartite-type tricarboxylate transporter receptor subunit TctC